MPEPVWGAPPRKGNARESAFEQYREALVERSKSRKNPEDWWGIVFEYDRPATAGTRATELRKRYPGYQFASRTTATGGAVWARVAPPTP